MTKYCIILTTCSNNKTKDKIINNLLDNKLSSCIQVQNIESFYHWKDKINHDNEKLLIIKTINSFYEKIEAVIKDSHDYEIPEIISIPITQGSEQYFNWMDQILSDQKKETK